MKKICIIIFFCGLYAFGFSQTNDIVVYSEKGEEFTLYVNSIKQNDPPAAHVRAKNISGASYTIRIQFADPSIPEVTQKYYTEEKNIDITWMVKQNNKGKWSVAYKGETPRVVETQPQQVQKNHHQYQSNTAPSGTVTMNVNDGRENVNLNMSVTESSMSIQAGAGEESVSINMNLNMGGHVNSTMTTTTTTSQGTSYYGTNPQQQQPQQTNRCTRPMSASDFIEAQNSIQAKPFSDTKISQAKQICKNSCMTSEQVRDMLKLFTTDSDRLEVAKYAYEYVFDTDKYYKVNDAFKFSTSTDELNKYIERR